MVALCHFMKYSEMVLQKVETNVGVGGATLGLR